MGIKPDIAQKEVIARIITTGMDTKPGTAQKVATPPTITTGTGTKQDIAQKEVIARTIRQEWAQNCLQHRKWQHDELL